MLANPRIRMGIAGVLILAVAYFVVLPRMSSSEAVPPELPEHPNPGPTYTVDSRVYNLLSASARDPRYLKLGVVFEFATDDASFFLLTGEPLKAALDRFAEELAPKQPVIDDLVSSIVGTKTLEQVSTAVGRQQLKEELLQAVRDAVGDPELLNIYFTEFVFQ